jgi:hypothetical protein
MRTISTQAELDTLPIGSIVMALWDDGPLHRVMQRYANGDGSPGGWYGFPSDSPLFPLGSRRQGETVALLWHPDDERTTATATRLNERAATRLNERELVAIRRQAHVAAQLAGQFVDPALITQCTSVLRRRGEVWAAAVLGHDLNKRSLINARLPWLKDHEPLALVLADIAEDAAALRPLEN